MADLTRTVDVILNGQDRITGTFRKVTEQSQRLRRALGAAGGVAAAGTATAAALAAAGTAASGKMAEGLASAYQQSIDFEAAMKDLEKVLGEQPELLDKAKQAAMELSTQYGKSSTEIVDSIANWAQAGYDIDEAMTLAEDSIAATYASELNMQEATDTLTKIMKGFGVDVEDARSKLDALNAISNNYSASVGQLSEALGRAAPEAESVGLSMEQLASLMTPAIEKFQDGRKVGTAFKTMLTKLQDDSKPVQQALDELGVSQRKANGQLRSGEAILYDVGEAFQGIKQEQQAFIASQLAGREHSGKFLATMNEWDSVSKVYKSAMDSNGSITEEVNNRLEAGETQVQRFQSAWENLAIAIGDRFRDNVTDAITSATKLVDAIQTGIEEGALDDFFDEIGSMAQDLAGYLDEIAQVMPDALEGVDWSNLAESVRRVGDAFRGWFDDLDLTEADDLETAIQKIADGTAKMVGLFETLVAMADDIAGFGADVGAVAQEIMDHSTATDEATYSVRDLGVASREMSPQAKKLGEALRYAKENTSGASNELGQFNEYLNYNVRDTHKSREALSGLQRTINSLTGKQLIVGAEADEEEAKEAGEKAQDQVPEKTKMKVEAAVEKKEIDAQIAEIEAAAEKTQAAFKWQGEVEIAQAEAQAEKVKAAFESASATIQDTSKQMSTLFDYLSDPGAIFSPGFYREVQDMIADEHESRQKLMERQSELTQKQIQLMEEKLNSMRDGEGLIQIEGKGLEPELEAFMWKIVERIQMRVNEQSAEFLLGIGST